MKSIIFTSPSRPVLLEQLSIYVQGELCAQSNNNIICLLEDQDITELSWESEGYSLMDIGVDCTWLDVTERILYRKTISVKELKKAEKVTEIIYKADNVYVSFQNKGEIVVLVGDVCKTILLFQGKGDECPFNVKERWPGDLRLTYGQVCDELQNSDIKGLFDGMMKQFTVRYQVLMEKWQGDDADVRWENYKEEEENVPEFDWIEESLYDGTHDKLHDGRLVQFHEAGKPKKLAIQFHKEKTEYTAYFWFEGEKIREVFDRFYGAHPETKTDFIIRIDAENKKYELALYRYGLKDPVTIKDDVYQLIVFKNKFEDYRSDNYNQPRGAWIW